MTATDIDGRLTLDVPTGKRELTFSYIGYSARTVEVDLTGAARKP